MTLSNDFHVFLKVGRLSKLSFFSETSLWSSILNHLQTKVTPKNPYSCNFFFSIYNPKEVRVVTNFIFLVLG